PVLFGFMNFLLTVIVRHGSLFSVVPTSRSPHALRPEIPAFRPIIQADSISSSVMLSPRRTYEDDESNWSRGNRIDGRLCDCAATVRHDCAPGFLRRFRGE